MTFVYTLTTQQSVLTALTQSLLKLRLFSNNWTPAKTDTPAQYTEVGYAGYAPKILVSGDCVIAIDGLTGNYYARYPKQTWTPATSITVYGYYITDNDNNNVIIAERFPDAPVITDLPIDITPTIGTR